jgi:iron-sulfur cluster repair protein YtfE (RIC family)
MFLKRLIPFLGILVFTSYASAQEPAETGRSRLEDLFIWKANSELKLDAKTQELFEKAVREVGKKKAQVSQEIEHIVGEMKTADAKQAAKLIGDYEKVMKKYGAIHQEELRELKNLLPPQKLAQYLVLKSEIHQKLREKLAPNLKKSDPASGVSSGAAGAPQNTN